ncbi:cryptochrome/photolyase family protein [Streptomyces collinus]
MTTPHRLFGDQLGPHFLAPVHGQGPDRAAPVVMIEARSVFRRRPFHRAKAHLVLSAMRHRAAELGERVTYVRAETYREGLRRTVGDGRVTVCHPTSYAALRLVRSLPGVRVLTARGFLVSHEEFAGWAEGLGGRRLLQENFYRWVRERHDLLMDGGGPAGGRFNHDHANREPPPRGATALDVPGPYRPREDDIDAGYWTFLHRHRHRFSGNARMRRAVQGLDRLGDLDDVLHQERQRGDEAP